MSTETGEEQQSSSESNDEESKDDDPSNSNEPGKDGPQFWEDATVTPLDIVELDKEGSTESSSTQPGESRLDKRIDSWKEQLLDLTRRNKLIDFTETKTKSLPLNRPDPLAIADTLFEGDELYVRKSDPEEDGGSPPKRESVADNEIAATRPQEATQNSLYRMSLRQKRAQEEKGVDALYIAFGMLEWYEASQSDDSIESPLFLVSVDLERNTIQSAARHDYEITPVDTDLRLNPALRKKLESERGLTLPADESFVLDELAACFRLLEERLSGFQRWTVHGDVTLGLFDFTKFGLYQDLEENREAVKADPLIQAINGDPSELEDPPLTPDAGELDDEVPSTDVYQVLDADSSQQEAIEAAKRGMDFVLQGPPGTGKSQTISNIIAEKLAAGETVLFVSEKRAALNVVKNRLEDNGLGRFCLEAHGEKANKKAVLESYETELRADPIRFPEERSETLEQLDELKRELNEYGEQLFWKPEGQDITPYEAFGKVSKLSECPSVEVGIVDPLSVPQTEIDTALQNLDDLSQYRNEIDNYHTHPWRATTLDSWQVNTNERVQAAISGCDEVVSQIQQLAPQLSEELDVDVDSLAAFDEAVQLLGLLVDRPSISFEESFFARAFHERGERLRTFAEKSRKYDDHRTHLEERYEESLFSEDGQELYSSLTSYGLFRFFRPSYRSLRSRILDQTQSDYDPDFATLREDMRRLMELNQLESDIETFDDLRTHLNFLYDGRRTDWDTVLELHDWIVTFESFDHISPDAIRSALLSDELDDNIDVQSLYATILDMSTTKEEAFDELSSILTLDDVEIDGQALEATGFEKMKSWLGRLHSTTDQLQEWIEFQQRLEEASAGLPSEYLDRFIAKDLDAKQLVDCFEKGFYTAWLNAAYRDTDLDSFSATEFENQLERFRQLDKQQQEYAKVTIQHEVTKHYPRMKLEYAENSEQVFLRREINKSRRHKPLRTLFREIPNLATTLKPCFMMSPLSVAQYIEYGTIHFDTVIFDEASQVMPQDAVSSLIRADQTIIAGDTKQLPPTTFFDASVSSADDIPEDLESILDEAASVLPERRLLWHYRSNTNELIEFSNQKYYDGRLMTFPENDRDSDAKGVHFDYVEDGLYDRGGASNNIPEARRVVDDIETHIENHPEKSLGVVAFSTAQANAIREEIERRRDTSPSLASFVDHDDTLEGFFVKSLENVQGDERDMLIFSVGYGPDETGKKTMTFGPLNHKGGERRLNVAVTRARDRITIVSSLTHDDIDLSRTESRGVTDFKHYLEYAQKGEVALTREDTTTTTLNFDSEFEEAVYTALEKEGFDVDSQVQSSGYSIDLAIKHPKKPGRYVLGIECDGAAYHSSKTARDRDRTRQTVLEDLGWTIHRIWSPDWASNQQAELDEIAERVERLLDGEWSRDDSADPDVVEIDPEPMDPAELGKYQGDIVEYREPSVSESRYREYKDESRRAKESVLTSLVGKYGPIETETAQRETVRAWGVSRLGKNIRSDIEKVTRRARHNGDVVERDGFLWPADHSCIEIRTNTTEENRSIEKIPLEELAKAGYVILENGGTMTDEDVVVEVARLFGYSRTGQNIDSRIKDSVDLLREVNAVETDSNGLIRSRNCDIDDRLL